MEKNTHIVEYFRENGSSTLGHSTATIFYSQCGEDLEIYCDFFANKREHYKENKGCYIEIGASDGVKFSNTKFFEDNMNFSGVLIEAEPGLYNVLQKTRPRNKLYNYAVSEKEGTLEFLVTNGPGGPWVSGIESLLSEKHKDVWHKDTKKIAVESKKMSHIMNESGLQKVDIFSIDVEGAEYEVINTIDWNIPIYVFIIELAEGDDETEKDIKCRDLLKEKGYSFHKRVGLSEVWYSSKYEKEFLQ